MLDEQIEIFVMHVTFLLTIAIHLARKAQIALLVVKEVKIPTEYSDFSDVFLVKKALILLETTKLNQYAIKLQKGQQQLYGLIYSLSLVKLKTLKTHIETNLANNFIRSSKFPTDAPIFFVGKPDSSFRLCVDY